MKYFGLALSILAFAACKSAEEKAIETTVTASIAGKSAHSDLFNQSFKSALDQYYTLKDAFVAENDKAVDSAAQQLLVLVDSIQLNEPELDKLVVDSAKIFSAGIKAELKGLLGEKKRDEKRKAFQMAGEQLYLLVRKVQYDQEIVYQQFCPMAFNDNGATWLSNSSDIKNPYLPKTMLHCGEVKDSVDLRVK